MVAMYSNVKKKINETIRLHTSHVVCEERGTLICLERAMPTACF